MHRLDSALVVALLVTCIGAGFGLLGYGCGPGGSEPPRVVRIAGVDGFFNYSSQLLTWAASSVEGRAPAMLVRDGDLLVLAPQGGETKLELGFPYRESDGTALSVRFEKHGVLLNGRTVCLNLTDEKEGWDWLGRASREEMTALRLVMGIDLKELNPLRLAAIEKLAAANPRVGLGLQEIAVCRKVLPLFKPDYLLVAEDCKLEKGDLQVFPRFRNLRYLLISGKRVESLEFLSHLPDLRTLVISDWDPKKTGVIPAGCTNLRSLILTDAEVDDLSPLAQLPRLDELLILPRKNSLPSIKGIAKLERLRSLAIAVSEKDDLSELEGLRNLVRLELCGDVRQDQFARVIQDHPALRCVEIVKCKNVTDLGPLRNLSKPECLVMLNKSADLAPIRDLKTLRFLVLPKDTFGDKNKIQEIRQIEQALPNCQVAAGEGVCLGSGWILLLLPPMVGAWLLSARRRARQPEWQA